MSADPATVPTQGAAPAPAPASFPPTRAPAERRGSVDVLAAMAKPLPFPPLDLMHDRTRTVSHAMAQSKRADEQRRRDKGKAKAEEPLDEAGISEGRRWKAGLRPGQAAKKLFPKPNLARRAYRRFFIKRDLKYGREWRPEELEEAARRGNFPHRPSDLFLKMYSDVLTCLTRDPLAGNVSPALIGTQGTIPLSIVSTIPDIMQHYQDCIVLAEKEVFLVTNYWQPSDSVKTVASGLKELNKRVGERKGEKVVVKIMWDRGAVQQLWHNHVSVSPQMWTPLGLPNPDEVPNLSLQVVNFHRPLLGTFHQKAMVVDRKIALLNSNNIQDRPNLEMMVHLEGPVVDSIYDNILISWHESLSPALPCLTGPTPTTHPDLFPFTFTDSNPYLANIDVAKAARAARKLLNRQDDQARKGEQTESLNPPEWWRRTSTSGPNPWPFGTFMHGHGHAHGHPHGLPRQESATDGAEGGKFAALVMQLIEKAREEKARLALGMSGIMNPGQDGQAAAVGSPAVMGSGAAASTAIEAPRESLLGDGIEAASIGSSDDSHTRVNGTSGKTLTGAETEKPDLGIKTQDHATAHNGAAVEPNPPGSNHPQEPSPTAAAASQEPPADVGKDLASTLPVSRNGDSNKGTVSSARLAALSKALNAGALAKIDAAIDDETLIHDFKPHLLHKAHEPFPIALVNRRPHGSPGHNDIRCPQAAAWLAALKYAERDVFIQTPTLNAAPIVRGVIEACSRGGKDGKGVPVTLFLGLGFNDKGESIPFQGGTNEEVVFRLFGQLRKLGKEDNLHVYWYTGKDQIRPLNAVHKSRNCHIKFMSVDGQCAIVGNGNLDSQSFWHSQEANILIDNPQIVADWMDQLRANQSTHKYGRVDTDGIWRDPSTGEELEKPKSISCFSAMRAVI
ncbi:hypothetical protein Rt10032_c02g1161 [Rhodotorula toruloides]|uniref:PLD phosphodiesterase domain-containing protein n=1 Tax=Rhodotorula toruloides TaxID=5286 RepID=A0A511KCM7_RHOTO|nr:hypothetical protein Rt10032_c02g1161 [Rhodotorula toruloides]